MKILAALLLFAFTALAQTGTVVPVPTSLQLMQYLNLTPDQLIRIQAANGDYFRLVAEKSARMAQVQREIAEETSKSPLDPMALGLRYAELEAIRRELRDEEAKVTPLVLTVLNDAQKAKLKTLEDAMKLQPLICEAQALKLIDVQPQTALPPGVTAIPIITGFPVSGSFSSLLLGGGCAPGYVIDPFTTTTP